MRTLSRIGTYLASPLSTYGTTRYDRILALLRATYPNEPILEPRFLFTRHNDWRSRWPSIVCSIARVVFFANDDRSLGAGVVREIHDARWHGVPTAFAADDGALVSTYTLDFTSADDPGHVAFVRIGGERCS